VTRLCRSLENAALVRRAGCFEFGFDLGSGFGFGSRFNAFGGPHSSLVLGTVGILALVLILACFTLLRF
jgi:hypothetical protein